MKQLCLTLLLFILLPFCASYGSDFYTEISADQLEYVAIEVPRHANYFEVQIWAESSSMNPTVLLRYDGLPTLTFYDAKVSIPSPPSVLQILDLQPTQSVLYLGLFGGSKLHRFRYFAGEAITKLVGVQTEIKSCPSEYQNGPNCTQSVSLATARGKSGASSTLLLTTNATSAAVVTIPQHVEQILMEILIPAENVELLCSELNLSNNDNITFVFDLFLDQPLEENNAGRRSLTFNHSALCVSNIEGSKQITTILVERPMPGVWTLQSSLRVAESQTSIDPSSSRTSEFSHTNTKSSNNFELHGDIFKRKKLVVEVVDRTVLEWSRMSSGDNSNPEQELSSRPQLRVPLTITTILSICPNGKTTSPTSTRRTGQYNVETPAEAQCTASVVAMDTVRTPLIARGVYALHGRTTLLPAVSIFSASRATANKEDANGGESTVFNPFVVFEAVLPSQVQRLAVGGGMILQLSVSLPETSEKLHSDQFVRLMDSMHFHVAARFAGLPGDPDVYLYDTKRGNNFDVRSPNAFLLSTRFATITDKLINSASGYDDDDSTTRKNQLFHESAQQWLRQVFGGADPSVPIDAHLRERTHTARTNTRTYTWVVTRPALPGLAVSSLDGVGSHLFIRVAREPTQPSEKPENDPISRSFGIMHGSRSSPGANIENTFASGESQSDAEEIGSTSAGDAATEALNVAASLLFEPCPKESCVHGECFVQEGDIAAFTCSCRYPWAGESCDSLSVPYPFYVIQALILTLSNLMMVPAVLLSVACELPFVATLLGSSAVASSVYHLCDIDVYCLGGLSFHSLQVMDILFSICCIASILLLYAPVSRPCHTALSLFCLALLVPPVADLPTSPVNLALALSFALIVLAVGWGSVLRIGDRRGSTVTPVLCGLFLHMRGDPLLHGTSEAAGDVDKPLTVVVNHEEMVYSSIARNSPDLREEDIEMIDLSQGRAGDDLFVGSTDPNTVLSEENCPKKCTENGKRVWVLPATGLTVGLFVVGISGMHSFWTYE
eukprot:gene19672-22372_t